jgi:hypothetical protein
VNRRTQLIALGLLVAVLASVIESMLEAETVDWTEERAYRLLVTVQPRDIGHRTADEMPARLKIDFVAELKMLGVVGRPDIASIRVVPYDPASGQRLPTNPVDKGSVFDAPFRWYDGAIPYEFPEFAESVTRMKGKITRKLRTRGGYFFNAIGDWKQGQLVWTHLQSRREKSFYAVYFDLLPSGHGPLQVPPRGWMGDGLPRCTAIGSSTMGADHCRIDVDDWNGDGLVDLIVGENYGHVLWWPNHGTVNSPKYPYSKFIFDSKGAPLDAGMIAAPKVTDWDGDGHKDLLVGTEWNRILFYRNLGDNRDRKLEYVGFVEIDGKPLQLPIEPLVRGSPKVFRRDYYPVLETVDWDGDGDTDLLAGGYITGRIYFYENAGRETNGVPRLIFRGPLQSNGKPLNVGHWCAAPCLADFDNDGDLDLVTGNMPMYVGTDDDKASETGMLQYYENMGTATHPQLVARPFPTDGSMPHARLATPRAVDWDGDGDVDLVISARENIYLFENQGIPEQPQFRVDGGRMPSQWGSSPLVVDQFRDWNDDGYLDLVNNYTVHLNARVGNPWRWDKRVSILPPGEYIKHPAGIGDDWFWPYVADLDQDQKVDVLFGDWHGHVWFHRNLSTARRHHFDVKGTKLTTSDGAPIKVGPIGKDPNVDFDALQGARTVLTMADFDRDGLNDLVVGDTYGKIRYFRNVGSASRPVFAPPQEIGDLGIRLLVDATDWNQDGWMDVIGGAANGRVRVFLNNGKQAPPQFAAGIDPGLPSIAQPRTLAVDLNGDGDDDLFLPSTQGSCYVERSFLQAGYAEGALIRVERK